MGGSLVGQDWPSLKHACRHSSPILGQFGYAAHEMGEKNANITWRLGEARRRIGRTRLNLLAPRVR